MTTRPALDPAELALLRSVFIRHPEISEVRLFGSRAKGVHAEYSDIDIALWGDVNPLQAQAIAADLDELPLPYRYDVQAFYYIRSRALREHIQRVGILIYPTSSIPEHPFSADADGIRRTS